MMSRRRFIAASGGLAALAATARPASSASARSPSRVALVKDVPRAEAIPRALELLGTNAVRGRRVLLKPNFNTADPFPASTHNDTLTALIGHLRKMGAGEITIGERCGPPETAEVLRDKGIPELCRALNVGLINFEELPETGWTRIRPAGSHWNDGFNVANPVLNAETVVTTCCLKTHKYGGVFTLSLKLSVGITNKRDMRELHTSFRSMRKMIAEINQAYTPAIVLMDGMEAFTTGGPSEGTLKRAGVIAASADRVAIDAVGVAILKILGSTPAIMDTPIFRQEQISSAAELGLGAGGPEGIELVTGDAPSRAYAAQLRAVLDQG